ncbi:MAG: hypothetical protein ACRD29_10420 [Acidimicrobiales bacterium]
MTTLLDGKVLVALTVADHVHHDAAESWFEALNGHWQVTDAYLTQLARVHGRVDGRGDRRREARTR